jgi:hypothetical protein
MSDGEDDGEDADDIGEDADDITFELGSKKDKKHKRAVQIFQTKASEVRDRGISGNPSPVDNNKPAGKTPTLFFVSLPRGCHRHCLV